MQHFIFILASICPITSIVEFFFLSFFFSPQIPPPTRWIGHEERGARVGSTRGMIRSRSGTIALCVAGKRRKIIDHGPVNMNGRSGSNRPGATLLRRNLQERDGARRTTRNPSIPDFAMFRVRSEGFSEAPEGLLLILLREYRKKNGERNFFHMKLNIIHNFCNNTKYKNTQQNDIIQSVHSYGRFERLNL